MKKPVPTPTPIPAASVPLPQSGGAYLSEDGVLIPDESTPSTQVTEPLGRAADQVED